MRNIFFPARSDLKHLSDCAQAADCWAEVEAIQSERSKELDRQHFQRSKRDMSRSRIAAFAGGVAAVGMLALGAVAVDDAISGRIQELVTILGVPFFGLTSIYMWRLSHQYGDALLYLGEHDRIRAKDAEEAAELVFKCNARMRISYIELFRAYRAAVAAVPAEGEGGDYAPSADVLFMNPNKKAVH
jgi:hypothetical protein